uniref:Venom protein n=1 Tax=Trichobilharzia regenti TaxID=157069 RepID=A0AA85IX03_TRIRE|nr:unnamed protein product [Trichobilharzia regenti]
MIEKHCLILAFVWTLFQLSDVLCNEISPAERIGLYILGELDKLIEEYSELYGRYKTAECVAFLAVRSPEISWTMKEFNNVIRDTKFQIFANTSVDYLNKLTKDFCWKNVNGFSGVYSVSLDTIEYVYSLHSHTVFENIGHKLGNMEPKIDLTTVFTDLVNSLRDAWMARKELLITTAMYYKTMNMAENHDIDYENEHIEEDLGEIIEVEFVKSRGTVEQKCQNMLGMQIDKNTTKTLLKQTNHKNVPKSEFGRALAQLKSEVQKLEKHRIDRLHSKFTQISLI